MNTGNGQIVKIGEGFNAVTRTNTGILHLSHTSNSCSVTCNSRNGGIRSARFVDGHSVIAASDAMFCRKCFTAREVEMARAAALAQTQSA